MKRFKELSDDVIRTVWNNSKSLFEICKKLEIHDNTSNRNKLKEWAVKNEVEIPIISVLTKDRYEKNPKLCKQCGNVILWSKRANDFCSHSCSATYLNLKRGAKSSGKYVRGATSICINCGNVIPARNQYCNRKCQAEYAYKEFIKRWKEGKELGMAGEDGLSAHIRRYLLEKANYTCEIPGCGCNFINPYTNLSILQIHHIDGDATNNKEENLQVLCPNHHAMTEHFGSRNKNSTRRYRYSKNK